MEGFGWGLIAGMIACLCLTMAFKVKKPEAIDVYRGKTTLR